MNDKLLKQYVQDTLNSGVNKYLIEDVISNVYDAGYSAALADWAIKQEAYLWSLGERNE